MRSPLITLASVLVFAFYKLFPVTCRAWGNFFRQITLIFLLVGSGRKFDISYTCKVSPELYKSDAQYMDIFIAVLQSYINWPCPTDNEQRAGLKGEMEVCSRSSLSFTQTFGKFRQFSRILNYLFDRIYYYGVVSHNFSSSSSFQCKNNSGTNRWMEKLDISKQINIMKGGKTRKIHRTSWPVVKS